MLTGIQGKITGVKDGSVTIDAGGLIYEVFIPVAVMKNMAKELVVNNIIGLVTYHYYQMEPSRGVPVLIGFQNVIEKEFFEKFITVSGVGPKAACKALAEPFSDIAGAIDGGDAGFLKKLPGIGDQRARLIVAKLQGKVGKYGLIRSDYKPVSHIDEDIKKEALDILLQLQYRKTEAEDMLDKAIKRSPGIKTSEELLNEVYRERKAT